ncbi:MAG: efflux RND transporter permease subunit [Planctomyces sp.]|nr:efflux RND transporter permease subunit [Planctomyces sp.]
MDFITACVHNPVKVTVGVILTALFGILAMFQMPMQLTPEVEVPTLTVVTTWIGASPQEIEREIVQEQEEQLKSVEGVTKVSSESYDSSAMVTLEFPVGTDMAEALLKVNTKLSQVPNYPQTADEPVINTSNASDRPVAWFILGERVPKRAELQPLIDEAPDLADELDRVYRARSEGLQLLRLRELAQRDPRAAKYVPEERDVSTFRKFAEDVIESRFEQVDGVSNANVLGGREEELQLTIDPEKLAARGLTIANVRQALVEQNVDTSAGDFWEGKRRYVVRTLGRFRSPEQVESVIIARRDGNPIYVRDVGSAALGHKKPDGFVRRFGAKCIAINAMRRVGANLLDVMDGLKAKNTELNEQFLAPMGLELIQVYDETEYIHSAVNLVRENLLEGALFTFITLLLFLRSGRSTIVIFVHILISTIGAFLVMWLLGRSLNVPALGGLAFAVGMLVDNAIVMLENIYRRHQEGEDAERASVNGAKEVWGALLNATLANLAVFLPVLFIKDEAGQLFRDIAIAISAAVALSMLVAVAVVPTTAYRLLRNVPRGQRRGDGDPGDNGQPDGSAPKRGPLARASRLIMLPVTILLAALDRLASWFVSSVLAINSWLLGSLTLRFAMITGVLAASILATWALLPKVEYLPNGNRNLIIALLLPPPGYNLNQLDAMGDIVETTLRPYFDIDPDDPATAELEYPAIEDFFFVARNRMVFVGARSVDPLRAAELIPLIQTIGDKLPGTFLVAKQASLFEQTLTGGRTIDVEITGPEIEKLVALGGQMMGQIMSHELLKSSQVRPNPSLDLSNPEVHVVPRWDQAADLQITARDLGYSIDAFVDGAYATDYFQGGEKIDLRIMGEERFAIGSQKLRQIPIATPTGQLVPLQAIADIELRSGPEQINHRTRQRAITLEVSPPATVPLEAAMEAITRDIVAPLEDGGQLAGGYRVALAGTADKLRSTWQSLRWNLLLAVLITYLLMAATFESWLYPFVVILTVPLGAVGGFAGLWILGHYYGQQLDVLTMLGFIMLVGTVVNNPILIVEQTLVSMRESLGPRGDAPREPGTIPLHHAAVMDAVRTRIRPIFMTTLGGLAGLLPLVLAPGAGSELYRGIGAVLLGGLLLSTVVTLVFVPALLSLMLDLRFAFSRLARRQPETPYPVETEKALLP